MGGMMGRRLLDPATTLTTTPAGHSAGHSAGRQLYERETVGVITNLNQWMQFCYSTAGGLPPMSPPNSPSPPAVLTADVQEAGSKGHFFAAKLRDAAGTNLGCRIENLVGTGIPTLMSSWVALMLVLIIQELPRLVKLVKKLLARYGMLRDIEDTTEEMKRSAAGAVEAAEATVEKFDPMAMVQKMTAGVVAKVTKRLAQQSKVTLLVISIFTFIFSTWLEEAWEPTIINSSPIDLALTFSAADGVDCSTTNCFSAGNITVGGDSRECVGALVYDEVLDANGEVDVVNSLLIQMGAVFGGTGETNGDLAFYGMLARAPLSSKLSVTWMIVIASTGQLIRADLEAKEKAAKTPSLVTMLESLRARVSLVLLLPLILLAVLAIFFVLLLALVASIQMIQLSAIWIVLALIAAVHYPLAELWKCLGVAPKKVDTSEFKWRTTKLLLTMSEGPLFKYYFTCYLHIATVVLQLFVQSQAMKTSLGKTTDEVVSHIYTDYFGMTSVSLEMSLPAIDVAWWLDFSPTIILSGISLHLGSLVPTDLALVLTCKVTYVFGIAFLLLEQSMALVEAVLVSATLKAMPAKGKGEVDSLVTV